MDFYLAMGSTIEVLLIMLMGLSLFNVNWRPMFTRILVVSLSGGFLLVIVKSNFNPMLYLLILLSFISILLKFVTSFKFKQVAVYVITGAVVVILCEVIVFSILTYSDVLEYFQYKLTPSLIHWVVLSFVILLLTKHNNLVSIPKSWRNEKSVHHLSDKKWLVLLYLLLVSLFLFFYKIDYGFRNDTDFLYAFCFMIIILYGLYLIKKHYGEEAIQIEQKIDEQYTTDMKHFSEVLQQQKYDKVQQLMTLRALVTLDKKNEAEIFIDRAFDEATQSGGIYAVKSKVLQGILFSQQARLLQDDVTIQYHIEDDLLDLPFKTYEVNQLFGTLLDRAAEELQDLPVDKKEIHIGISKDEQIIRIEISNISDIRPDKNKLIDVSKLELNKGFTLEPSLNKLETLLNKYNGEMKSNIFGDMRRSIIDIPFKG